jgi:hypothetical protein
MSDGNPYASPRDTSVVPQAETLQWQLDGDGLLVKDRTVLPAVDLETGARNVELVTVMRRHVRSYSIVFLIAAFGGVISALVGSAEDTLSSYFLVVLIAVVVLRMVFRTRPMVIWDQREAVGYRRQKVREKLRMLLALLGPALFVSAGLFGGAMTPFTGLMSLAGISLMLLALVVGLFGRSNLKVSAGPDNWMRIRNLHPDAIAYLTELEHQRYRQQQLGGSRKTWKVYTAYLYRYPLRLLIDRKTGIWRTIVLTLMKLLRSRQLEQTMLAADEEASTDFDCLHGTLQEAVNHWIAAHPEWTVDSSSVLDAPFSGIRKEYVTLVEPTLTYVLSVMAVWAKANPDLVRCYALVYSWAEDDLLLVTTNTAVIQTGREGVDYRKAAGDVEAVFRTHLERCASRRLRHAGSIAEIKERLMRERAASTKELEILRWNSPVREIS